MVAHTALRSTRPLYFLGSSVTRGHGGDTDGISFSEMISAQTGYTIEKQAVSGTTMAVRPGRNDSYVERFDLFSFAQEPYAIFIQLSTNDFSEGVPVGTRGGAETVMGAVEALIEKCASRAPDARVAFFSCPLSPMHPAYRAYKGYLPILKDLAARHGVSVIDLFGACRGADLAAYLQEDGLHPTAAGYRAVFTPAFLAFLSSGAPQRLRD